jgi:hypothetical protein
MGFTARNDLQSSTFLVAGTFGGVVTEGTKNIGLSILAVALKLDSWKPRKSRG